jgi:hypothetical protein
MMTGTMGSAMDNLVFLVAAPRQTVRAVAAVLEADGCLVEQLDAGVDATLLGVATNRDPHDIQGIVSAIAPGSRLTEAPQ